MQESTLCAATLAVAVGLRQLIGEAAVHEEATRAWKTDQPSIMHTEPATHCARLTAHKPNQS